jgi:ribosomal protein S18 acetylase RimI-like enzyme
MIRMIKYTLEVENLKSDQLKEFFAGWANPPSPKKHLEILMNSFKCFLAMDEDKVVGFINAISDGTLSAYIPLLEVLPGYQNSGIGKKLVELMIEELSNFYMIDLVCDENMKSFYGRFGMKTINAMGIRNYEKQNGEK